MQPMLRRVGDQRRGIDEDVDGGPFRGGANCHRYFDPLGCDEFDELAALVADQVRSVHEVVSCRLHGLHDHDLARDEKFIVIELIASAHELCGYPAFLKYAQHVC